MPMAETPADLSSLSLGDIARLAAQRKLPPVEQWNPPFCGHSGMRIARDGTWFHEGKPITREPLVRLFATILRREPDGSFMLVTPVEKLAIDVEDAPFVAVEVKCEGSGRERVLAFRLNIGEVILAGRDHPIRLAAAAAGPHPYLEVRPYLEARGGLEALIARPVYYELAELALSDDLPEPGLWSNGAFFAMDGIA
jgi:hypothetical protein